MSCRDAIVGARDIQLSDDIGSHRQSRRLPPTTAVWSILANSSAFSRSRSVSGL